MKLNQQHMNVILKKFQDNWKESKECPICKQDKWTISDRFYEVGEFGALSEREKKISPFVIVSCSNCGNSLFFNAMVMGFQFTLKTEENEEE